MALKNINTFILLSLGIFLASCSSSNYRAFSSVLGSESCSGIMKNFIKGDRSTYLKSDDLHQLTNLDEELFETYKLERLEDLVEGRVREGYRGPLDKIAHLEAIVEFKMKYPVLSGFQDNHRVLSKKRLKRLSKTLKKVDFNSDWSLGKYRNFIFKYYSIMNTNREIPYSISSFKVATADFIVKRTEQQILMSHVAPNMSVVNKVKNRIKLFLSIASNIAVINNIGIFYTFSELRMFTPNEKIISKILENGILPNLEELITSHRVKGGVELGYNELRPYLTLAGIGIAGAAIFNTYQNGEDYLRDTIRSYEDYLYKIIEVLAESMSDNQKEVLVDHLNKELQHSPKEIREFYQSVIEILSK